MTTQANGSTTPRERSCECFIPCCTPSKGCFKYALWSWNPLSGLKSCFWPETHYYQMGSADETTDEKVIDCWCCSFVRTPKTKEPSEKQ